MKNRPFNWPIAVVVAFFIFVITCCIVHGQTADIKTDSGKNWQALRDRGLALLNQGKYTEAQEDLEKAEQQAKSEFGKEHPNYATSLTNLAELYRIRGQYSKAEPLFLEALMLKEKSLGKEHPDYATILNNLAALYRNLGQYTKAEASFFESLKLREKVLGKEHPDYAASLNGLAYLYFNQGQYEKAEPLHLEALTLRGKVLGKDHPDYATSLNNLALLYSNQGQYYKAEPLYLEALKIREKVLGKNHTDYAGVINNLAYVYFNQGQYIKAEPLFSEALKVRGKVFGKEHPDYGTSLNNLALLYSYQGKYSKAEPLYIEGLEVREKALGKEHPSYAISLDNLALLYCYQGLYDKAEPLYLEALRVREKALGKNHPYYATSLDNLGNLYYNEGQNVKAETLYQEALKAREKSLGKNHPDYATSLNNLANLYVSQGEQDKAEPLYLKAHQTYFELIGKQMNHLSEKEKQQFLSTFLHNFEVFHSFVLRNELKNPSITISQFNNLLVTKALLFDQLNSTRNAILGSNNKALIVLYKDWFDKRNFLAKAYSMGVEERKKRGIDLDLLEKEANDIEKRLSLQSSAFSFSQKRYTFEDVQSKLKHSQAAIEMVRFRFFDKVWLDSVMYCALIVTKKTSTPQLVIFSNGKKMERQWLSYYKNCINNQREDTISYGNFWQAIASHPAMKGIRKVYFSPDGVYNELSVQTLFNPANGRFLFDELDVELLNSTRSLAAPKNKLLIKKEARLFGFPNYGHDSSQGGTEPTENAIKRFFSGGVIPALPGTEKEVDYISSLLTRSGWKLETLKSENANEDRLKSMPSPRLLHIATHGFFLSDEASREAIEGRSLAGIEVKALTENPLLRSGLLLARAQLALDGKTEPGQEDGILTAYEAQNLNLVNTDLVVLSACETGLGEVKNGEGVYGLQRSFQTAGARAVLMSLWKVNDQATEKLMEEFYATWQTGISKRKAFKQAQRALRKSHPHPYYWGAFVMMGE
jgi:CHAT domain-containing protein/Tfp pilus assembly protein PilF